MSDLSIIDRTIQNIEWIESKILGKADSEEESILADLGFIRALLRESERIIKEVKSSMNTKVFKKSLKDSTSLLWKTVSKEDQKIAIDNLVNLIEGLPSSFTPKVKSVLEKEGNLVIKSSHKQTVKDHESFELNPSFNIDNKKAVEALRDSTSIFFGPEYERKSKNFRKRAQKIMSQGIEDGLSSRDIGRDLRREFRKTAINQNYWETVASVHVNRARSFSQLATYFENGVTEYEVIAIIDAVTTDICKMMDGTILSVEKALEAFILIEDGKTLDAVKNIAPFLKVRSKGKKKEIILENENGESVLVSEVTDSGKYPGKLDSKGLNKIGINSPPYHMRCRTTISPVIS